MSRELLNVVGTGEQDGPVLLRIVSEASIYVVLDLHDVVKVKVSKNFHSNNEEIF